MTCGARKRFPEGFTKILSPSFQQLMKHCTLHPTHPETHPPRHKPCPQSKSINQSITNAHTTGGTSEGKLACLPCLMPQRLHVKKQEAKFETRSVCPTTGHPSAQPKLVGLGPSQSDLVELDLSLRKLAVLLPPQPIKARRARPPLFR